MATRVLIINKQLVFAVTIKQALEQTGAYEVHPFTAADAALDYLQEHPQDVALVDFTLPGTTGAALVQRLRAVQPDLAIIASPRPSEPTEVMRALRLQGMINLPFTVRDIVPLIEQAVENIRQDAAIQPAADEPVEQRFPSIETRILEEPSYGKTRLLDDEPPPVPSKTRILDDDQPDEKFYGETRILDDDQPPGVEAWGTHIADDSMADLGGETPQFRRSGATPEISNLDSVLANLADSSLFEPPIKEGDTPSISTKDSDALRQFLATAGDFAHDATFDDILEAIDSGQVALEDSRQQSDFDHLVESLRSSEPHTALPDRQQQFMDFILTSGMDAVLQEIEKVKTGAIRRYAEPPSEQESASTFQKLAAEEPPMPTLEESGTIGDLMIGVSDRSFRNVLAVLRGEEVSEESEARPSRTMSEDERAEVLARFYEPVTDAELPPADLPAPPEMPPAADGGACRDIYRFEEPATEDEAGDSTLAQIILETTLDENTLGFPLDELMTSIENRLSVYRPDVQPLPSWGPAFERRKREEEKLIREPDFLPEELPPPEELPASLPELEVTDRFSIETTKPSSRQVIESHPEDIETDLFAQSIQSRQVAEDTPTWQPVEETQEFTPLPPAEPSEEAPETGAVEEGAAAEFASDWALEQPPPSETPVVEAAWPAEATIEPPADRAAPVAEEQAQQGIDDARIAQMALNLTQASLELTAEATLLTRQGELVASAGHLAPEDADELGDIIANDWDAQTEGARIRYITLPSSGRDYMLYSLKTDEGFTLSLIFAGTTPLRVIRRQGQRLAAALQAVPEAPVFEETPPLAAEDAPTPTLAAPPAPTPLEVKALTPYTYVWLLRDPNRQLSRAVEQAIQAGLSIQLAELGWRIKSLQVSDDHIYLLADVPGDTPAQQIIRDLKRRSADIAHAQDSSLDPAALWADSYFILTPGRALDMDEIAEFINFERM